MTQHDPRKIREQLGVDQNALLSPKNPQPFVFDDPLMDLLTHEDIFSSAECERIVKENTPDAWDDRGMGFIEKNEDTLWLFDKMLALCMSANQHKWKFEIDFFESLQLAKFDDGMQCDWSLDLGAGLAGNRKLSVAVQLSAPDDYEGGNFVLDLVGDEFTAPRGLGSVTVFPSFMKYKVEPVTKGTRYFLIVWCSGTNRFR